MARFRFVPTQLDGLVVVERQRAEDARGFFSRFYCAEEFRAAGLDQPIVQINHTLTRRTGAIRGLHLQHPPHAEDKVVSCLHGKVFDVAVDVRHGSPTFLKWHGEILSADNARSLLIPRGFAHGFQALESDCELVYLHSAAYAAGTEGALHVSDPRLGIDWPLAFADISQCDQSHPCISEDFTGIRS